MENKKIDVRRIAELSKLSFSEDELSALEGEMEKIVRFVSEINGAETENVSAREHILAETNVLRDDVPIECDNTEEIVSAAKTWADGYVTVPRVVEG